MGAFGIWQWLVVLVIVLVLFGGKGKISSLMGDFGKGLKSFKKGMKDEGEAASDETETETPKALNSETAETVEASTEKDKAANS